MLKPYGKDQNIDVPPCQKVLHICQTDIRSDSRVLKQINALKKNGFVVKGVGVRGSYVDSGIAGNTTSDLELVGVSFKGYKRLPKIFKHAVVMLSLLFRCLIISVKFRPNFVHCHDTIALPIGVFLGVLMSAKVIYDAHELESNRNGLTKLLGHVTLRIEKCLWRFIDALIVVSPSIGNWYQTVVGPKLYEIILNSPDNFVRKKTRYNYLRQKFGIDSHRKIFIYNGIFGPGRSLNILVEIFKKTKIKSDLVLLGYGPLEDTLRLMSENVPNIHFHPAVEHVDVVPITSSADFGVCLIENCSLSDYYSLPNKLFEYAFAGIPVVGSKFPDIENLIFRHNLGVVSDLDSQSILTTIEECQDFDVFATAQDLHLISWAKQEQKLVKLYNSLLSE
jgi:glycosyltransferase involved in cell wall biosynthesis